MRTTVTLDEDVERLLRKAMQRGGRGFKETLNMAIRVGLGRKAAQTRRCPFVINARPMGLSPGLDATGFNKLVDEIEADAFVAKAARPGAK
jgi:hypothetical protein